VAQPATVTIVGTALRPGGSPESGIVKFEQPVDLRSGTDGTIIAQGERAATIADDGSFSLTVYRTDDPAWSPQGWTYRVTLGLSSSTSTYDVQVPGSLGATVELADLLPALSPSQGAQYAPIGHTHSGGGSGGDPAGTAQAIMNAHVAAPDPHPQYLTQVEGDGRYDAAGAASAAVAAHTAASDPHPVYLTAVEGDGRYDPVGAASAAASAAVAGHVSSSDPHPQYLTQVEGDARYQPVGSGGGGAVTATFERAIITSGDVPLPSMPSQFAPLAGLTLTLPAVAGDQVEFSLWGLLDRNAVDNYVEAVVLVDGLIVRYASTGTGTANTSNEGDPAMYPEAVAQRFSPLAGPYLSFEVTPADLDDGAVTFALAHRGVGGGKVFASGAYPFRMAARNDHQ
jgi:hypothetical protein